MKPDLFESPDYYNLDDLLTEEHKLIRDAARAWVKRDVSPIIEEAAQKAEFPKSIIPGLAEIGAFGPYIPEEYGGAGLDHISYGLIMQEIERGDSGVRSTASVQSSLVMYPIWQYGSEEQRQKYLPKLASGEWVGTLAVSEGPLAPSPINLTVARSGDTVSGKKLVVPHGLAADFAVVLVTSDAGTDLVLAGLEAVERSAVEIVDPSIAAATIDFAQTPCESLGEPGDGWAMLETLQHRAAVLYAFEQIGGAEQALNMAVAYAKERFAFGRPIGSFQALKHMMADMYVALKLAESNAYYAAWALQNDAPDLHLAAATARVSATQAFQLCARDNIQVHGGMGFTWAFDCHLFYRRSNYLALALGGLNEWENKLVDALPSAVA